MNQRPIYIRFPGVDPAAASNYSQDLASRLKDIGIVNINRIQEREGSQDPGTALEFILGTASITAIAQGIAVFLQRNSGSQVTIESESGLKVTVRNVNSSDAVGVVEAAIQKVTG